MTRELGRMKAEGLVDYDKRTFTLSPNVIDLP